MSEPSPFSPQKETEGEFVGWYSWRHTDPYENAAGPFHVKRSETGESISALRVENRHLNAGGAVHGGCLASFADFAAFCIAGKEVANGAVTASLSVEYLSAAHEGALLTCTGDMLRGGKSLVFVRGVIKTDDNAVASFHAVLKKINRTNI